MLPYHWHILPESSDFSINGLFTAAELNGQPPFLQEDQFANEEPEPEARFLGFLLPGWGPG